MSNTIHVARIVMLACWPVVAWAGSVTLGSSFGALSWQDVLVVLAVSLFSGAVALLQRMDRLETPKAPTVWVTAHMGAATMAGMLAFFICEANDVNDFYEAEIIALASWLGARVIDAAANKLFIRLAEKEKPP